MTAVLGLVYVIGVTVIFLSVKYIDKAEGYAWLDVAKCVPELDLGQDEVFVTGLFSSIVLFFGLLLFYLMGSLVLGGF